jgi:hypothetical protein
MKKCIVAASLVCAVTIRSWACLGPSNIEGVAFTADEVLNIEIIRTAGTENVNYYIDGESEPVGIRYMSHYDSRAMVFIGNYGLSYQNDIPLNCMGIILPLPDTGDHYVTVEKTEFDFAAAVITELRWLAANEVLSLTEAMIARIDSSLAKTSNGGSQYWTHTNTVLAYNSWYTYDTTEHKWAGADLGVDGVRGVSGVNGVWGCSAINPDVAVPPEGLDPTSVARNYLSINGNRARQFRLSHFSGSGLTVSIPQNGEIRRLTIFNCKGAVVCRRQMLPGVRTVKISGLPWGMYTGRLK